MLVRSHSALAALVAAVALVRAAPPAPAPVIAYHPNLPAALKEAKTLRVPALVVLAKPKVTVAALGDPRVVRASKSLACAAAPLTPALAKQYDLPDESRVLILDADGTAVEKFAADVAPEKLSAAINKRANDARLELVKDLNPDSDPKGRRAALNGLIRLGPLAADLIPLLTDPDGAVKEAARKALAALPADATMTPLLAALKSDDAALRAAVHPFAAAATGYKQSPLKVWQTGTAEERAAEWDKWNTATEAQFPALNRAVIAFCESKIGTQVNNGECAMLLVEAYGECKAKPMRHSGDTYVWGRELKPGEPVLPGDVVQYEKAKFANGSAPHHTSVIRKVLAPGKYEILEQNVNGVKKVQPGKLDLSTLKEGTVVIYRPEPR